MKRVTWVEIAILGLLATLIVIPSWIIFRLFPLRQDQVRGFSAPCVFSWRYGYLQQWLIGTATV